MTNPSGYAEQTEKVTITWMDGTESAYMANSTRVDNGELIIYGAVRYPSGEHEPDQHVPLANIRIWFKKHADR
jgi:hypothetical protein